MREIPILFSTPMVQAINELRKNMTRRLNGLKEINQEPDKWQFKWLNYGPNKRIYAEFYCSTAEEWRRINTPWQPGDRLWVRETWYYESHMHDLTAGEPDLPGGLYSHRFVYRASSPDYPVDVGVGEHGWKPSIFMPKVATRIWLEVVSVRVERLQDITEENCYQEGISRRSVLDYRKNTGKGTDRIAKGDFKSLWDSINAKRGYGWAVNPFVWVVEFRRAA